MTLMRRVIGTTAASAADNATWLWHNNDTGRRRWHRRTQVDGNDCDMAGALIGRRSLFLADSLIGRSWPSAYEDGAEELCVLLTELFDAQTRPLTPLPSCWWYTASGKTPMVLFCHSPSLIMLLNDSCLFLYNKLPITLVILVKNWVDSDRTAVDVEVASRY